MPRHPFAQKFALHVDETDENGVDLARLDQFAECFQVKISAHLVPLSGQNWTVSLCRPPLRANASSGDGIRLCRPLTAKYSSAAPYQMPHP